MKRLLTLAALLAIASTADAGPILDRLKARREARAQTGPRVSACVSAPPLALTFTYTPANGQAVVNPVRSALGRWVAPATCVGGQCGK